MVLHVAATYKACYKQRSLCASMVEWLVRSLSKQKSGCSILGRCINCFCFVLFAKHLLSHKSVKSVSYQCNIELICLFALRFSVPVNFMSCGAEPPHTGYKAMLVKFICLTRTQHGVKVEPRTFRFGFRSSTTYPSHSPAKSSSGLGRVRQYMYVYMSASDTYT